ncbi:unnamed protein product [Staurois parvus]|uniref:Uncharacterized protein n=1 Tax=Staurois parvus TaxID=386267 RepID=A0ABN9DPK4_9NEOB|nr:unnamed protein product [Staurois parvus]
MMGHYSPPTDTKDGALFSPPTDTNDGALFPPTLTPMMGHYSSH